MSSMSNKKILVITEGIKTEVDIFKQLQRCGLVVDCEIVAYASNIHNLLCKIEDVIDDNDFTLLSVLAEKEPDAKNRKKLEDIYTDVILIFDLDPQDKRFQDPKRKALYLKLVEYFSDSTDQGQLYLSYPMVEALFDKPGDTCLIKDAKKYKSKVKAKSKLFEKFATSGLSKKEYLAILKQHWYSASSLVHSPEDERMSMIRIYDEQVSHLEKTESVYVLSTSIFYLVDYWGLKVLR